MIYSEIYAHWADFWNLKLDLVHSLFEVYIGILERVEATQLSLENLAIYGCLGICFCCLHDAIEIEFSDRCAVNLILKGEGRR